MRGYRREYKKAKLGILAISDRSGEEELGTHLMRP